jgi:hypothetical protein
VSALEKSKRRPFHATWSLLIVVAIASTPDSVWCPRCCSVAVHDKSGNVCTVDVFVLVWSSHWATVNLLAERG